MLVSIADIRIKEKKLCEYRREMLYFSQRSKCILSHSLKGTRTVSEFKLLIDGKLVGSSTGKTIEDISPATGKTIAEVPESTMDDMNHAVAAARAAYDDGRWSGLTHGARSYCLGETGLRWSKNMLANLLI